MICFFVLLVLSRSVEGRFRVIQQERISAASLADILGEEETEETEALPWNKSEHMGLPSPAAPTAYYPAAAEHLGEQGASIARDPSPMGVWPSPMAAFAGAEVEDVLSSAATTSEELDPIATEAYGFSDLKAEFATGTAEEVDPFMAAAAYGFRSKPNGVGSCANGAAWCSPGVGCFPAQQTFTSTPGGCRPRKTPFGGGMPRDTTTATLNGAVKDDRGDADGGALADAYREVPETFFLSASDEEGYQEMDAVAEEGWVETTGKMLDEAFPDLGVLG